MNNTMQLLDRALTMGTLQQWTRRLELTKSQLSVAKHSGHLTPILAGAIAAEMGENVANWTTLAVLEGAKDSAAKRALIKKLTAVKNSATL